MSPSLSPAISSSSKVRVPSKLSRSITCYSSNESSSTSYSTTEPEPTSAPNPHPPKLSSLQEELEVGSETVSPQDSCNENGWIDQNNADSAAEVQSRLDHIAALFPRLELENPSNKLVGKKESESDGFAVDVAAVVPEAVEETGEELNSPTLPPNPFPQTDKLPLIPHLQIRQGAELEVSHRDHTPRFLGLDYRKGEEHENCCVLVDI